MDRSFLWVPAIAGVLGVLQSAINRKIGDTSGLAMTVIFNNIILLISSLILGLVVYRNPSWFPAAFQFRSLTLPQGPLPYLPAVMGLCFLLLVPYSFMKVGAYGSYVVLISAQVVTTLIWDAWVEGIAVSPLRLLGAGLCILGAGLSALPKG